MTLNELKEKHGLTGARIALLTGVSQRAVRAWLATEGSVNYAKIPTSAWRLLKLLLGETTIVDILEEVEKQAANDKKQTGGKMSGNFIKDGKPRILSWESTGTGKYSLIISYPDGQQVRAKFQPNIEGHIPDLVEWAKKNGFIAIDDAQ